MNRDTLIVGGERLGSVPKLAICKNIFEDAFSLSHCDEEWDVLCSVESRDSIEEIKALAEKHYRGIGEKWIETNYLLEKAKEIYEEERTSSMCSFCGKSWLDSDMTGITKSENARICHDCVLEISESVKK